MFLEKQTLHTLRQIGGILVHSDFVQGKPTLTPPESAWWIHPIEANGAIGTKDLRFRQRTLEEFASNEAGDFVAWIRPPNGVRGSARPIMFRLRDPSDEPPRLFKVVSLTARTGGRVDMPLNVVPVFFAPDDETARILFGMLLPGPAVLLDVEFRSVPPGEPLGGDPNHPGE